MGRIRERISHTGHGPDRVGAGPEMCDLPQALERYALLLERVGLRVGETERLNLGCLDLDTLALAGRLSERSRHSNRTPDGEAEDIGFVVG